MRALSSGRKGWGDFLPPPPTLSRSRQERVKRKRAQACIAWVKKAAPEMGAAFCLFNKQRGVSQAV